MTITSELRGHAHKHHISAALSMVNRLVRWERYALAATVTARVDVETDLDLRELLLECSDFWEFDTENMVLTRKYELDVDRVRTEIGVNGLEADHVWKLLAETDPAF